jgi:hypothetical protein
MTLFALLLPWWQHIGLLALLCLFLVTLPFGLSAAMDVWDDITGWDDPYNRLCAVAALTTFFLFALVALERWL